MAKVLRSAVCANGQQALRPLRLTDHVAALGIPVLPPIDVETYTSEWVPPVPRPVDILDAALWDRVMILAHLGAIFFVHSATPCNTFSAARKLDGGLPALRSEAYPLSLPDLSPENHTLVILSGQHVCGPVGRDR